MDIPSVTLISTTIGLGEECEHWSREFVPELRPRLYSPEHTALLHIWLLCAPCTHCKSEHKRTHTHTHMLHLLLCTHAHTHTNTPSHTSFLWMFWVAHPQDAQVDREEGGDTHKRDLTHSHVWRDSFTCVTRLIHMFGMTHPHVWHDWFTCVTWRGHLYSNVWHDSVTCVTWLIRMCGMTDSNVWHDWITCVALLIHMCGVTHSHMWHNFITCVAQRGHLHSHVWYDSFQCVAQLIHMCGMTHPHVWYDPLTCVAWLVHMYLTTWSSTYRTRAGTGWRRPIGCLKLQVIFRKRATYYRALLQKMTCKDQASYGLSPPCNVWYDSEKVESDQGTRRRGFCNCHA